MVKKLLKHEFIYYFRSFGLFLPIVLVIGVMARVFECFDNGETINNIIIGSANLMLVVSCGALLVLSSVAGIVRFYKNMFSAEGYLTFTLPVTNQEHIFVKLVAAVAFEAACVIVVLLTGMVALAGEDLETFWLGIRSFYTLMALDVGDANMIGYIVEFLLLTVVSGISGMLLYYACIAIGQTAKKHRILKAILAYFVWYIITQAASTLYLVVLMVMGEMGRLDSSLEWIVNNPYGAIHVYFWGSILLTAGVGALFWFVTQKIMTKKLNLE